MKKVLILIFILVTLVSFSEDVTPSDELIEKLVEVKGEAEYLSSLGDRITKILEAMNIDIPTTANKEVKKLIEKKNIKKKFFNLYKNNYSKEEIESLIEFYSSEIGQKILLSENQMRLEIEMLIQTEVMKIIQIGLAEYYLNQ